MSGMEWYYAEGDETKGPFDVETLFGLLMQGQLNGETLIWKEGFEEWVPLAQTELMQGLQDPTESNESPNETAASDALESDPALAAGVEPATEPAFDPREGLAEELKSPIQPGGIDVDEGRPAAVDEYLATFQSGAYWFYWIAGLTVLNAILIAVSSPVILALGLGAAELVSWMAYDVETGEIDSTMMWIAVGVAIVLSLLMAGIGWMASQGNRIIYLVGMVIVALDTIFYIFPIFSIIALAVHGYALYAMFNGFAALQKIEEIEKKAALAKCQNHVSEINSSLIDFT
ncbi:MAG: GYF domain-containing protein [Verrucomicrobiota bacterium]